MSKYFSKAQDSEETQKVGDTRAYLFSVDLL